MHRALLIITSLLFCISAMAQTSPVTTKRFSVKLNDRTIVKDSTGRVIPYADWQPLLRSGDYTLKPQFTAKDTIFLLRKLSAEERKLRQNARANPLSSVINPSRQYKLGEKTIVKDSAGHVIPYAIWQPMLQSGEYTLRSKNPGSDTTVFTLRRATEEDKKRRQELANRKPTESLYFTTGQPLTPFEATDIFGKKITAQDWAGKIVVLCFWYSTWAGTPKMVTELNKLEEKYHNNPKIIFIAVALDDEAALKDFNTLSAFNYRLVAGGRPLTRSLKIMLFPTHVVVDKKGIVRFHTLGFTSNIATWIDRTITESEAPQAAKTAGK